MVLFFFFKPRFLARTDDGARDAALRGAAAAAALDEPRREGGARRPHPLAARARQGAVPCRVASCCVAVCGRDVCVMCCAVLWRVWVVVCGRGAERILARARQGIRARARSAAATRRQHGEWNTRRARMPPCRPLEDPPRSPRGQVRSAGSRRGGRTLMSAFSPTTGITEGVFASRRRENHEGCTQRFLPTRGTIEDVRFLTTREPPRINASYNCTDESGDHRTEAACATLSRRRRPTRSSATRPAARRAA